MIFITCLRCHHVFGRLSGQTVHLCSTCAAEDLWRNLVGAVPPPPLSPR